MNPSRSTVLLSMLVLGGCDKLPFIVSNEEHATRACEERLKTSLTSPSSYQRTWSTFTPADPLTKAEMIASDEADRVQALKEGNDAHAMYATYARNCLEKPNNKECDGLRYEQLPHPPTAFVLIEYEAANAFNAKLPGFFSCRVNVRDDGKYSESSILTSTAVPEQIGKRLKSQAELIKNASN